MPRQARYQRSISPNPAQQPGAVQAGRALQPQGCRRQRAAVAGGSSSPAVGTLTPTPMTTASPDCSARIPGQFAGSQEHVVGPLQLGAEAGNLPDGRGHPRAVGASRAGPGGTPGRRTSTKNVISAAGRTQPPAAPHPATARGSFRHQNEALRGPPGGEPGRGLVSSVCRATEISRHRPPGRTNSRRVSAALAERRGGPGGWSGVTPRCPSAAAKGPAGRGPLARRYRITWVVRLGWR